MKNEQLKNKEDKRTNYEPMAVARNVRPLLNKILGKNGIMQIEILSRWNEIIGDDLAKYSFPEKIEFRGNSRQNGVVHLVVPSGAFALELQHRERTILGKINEFFGYAAVSSLRIRQDGEINFSELKKNKKVRKNVPLQVSEEEKQFILESSQDVQDEKLKEILIKLGYCVFNDINKNK